MENTNQKFKKTKLIVSKAERKKKKKLVAENKRKKLTMSHFEQEILLCEKNWKICSDKWNDILGKILNEEMKQDYMTMMESFQTVMTSKEKQICLIVDEFEELDEQSVTISAGHISGLNELIGTYENRVKYFNEKYLKNIGDDQSLLELEHEISEKAEKRAKQQMNYFISQENSNKEVNGQKRDEKLNEAIMDSESKHFTDMEKLTTELEDALEWLIIKLETTLKTYLYFNATKMREFENLNTRDSLNRQLVFKQQKQIEKLKIEIRQLKNELNENKPLPQKEEKELLLKMYLNKKMKIAEPLTEDKIQIRNLSTEANFTVKCLFFIWKKLEDIILFKNRWGICKKNFEDIEESSYNDPSCAQESSKIQKFWDSFGRVKMSKLLLQQEIDSLENQNRSMKEDLKTLFQIISHGKLHCSE